MYGFNVVKNDGPVSASSPIGPGFGHMMKSCPFLVAQERILSVDSKVRPRYFGPSIGPNTAVVFDADRFPVRYFASLF